MARHPEAGVVPSILEEGLDQAARRLTLLRSGFPLVEIRADHLRVADLAPLIRISPTPVVVTVRAREEGGFFDGSAEERRRLLEEALRAGAAFVDVEWKGPSRELALGPLADRVVLSDHDAPCEAGALLALYREMAATPAALLKIVPRAKAAKDALVVRELLSAATADRRALASFALGSRGSYTRILALSWGSWGTYGSTLPSRPTADGQLGADELLDTYRVNEIGVETRRFALCGREVGRSPSPALHGAAHREAERSGLLLPLEVETVEDLLPLVGPSGPLGIEGLAVTIPLKESVAERSSPEDEVARLASAVNTVRIEPSGWKGFNTDGPAALERIRARIDPAGARVAIAGAGGTARAIAVSLRDAGAAVALYGRTRSRVERVGSALGVVVHDFVELEHASWDVLVQATPLGRRGEEVVSEGSLRGKLVLDAVYGPDATPLARSARARGIEVVDGYELLVAQAVRQIEILTGTAPTKAVLEEALDGWRAARA